MSEIYVHHSAFLEMKNRKENGGEKEDFFVKMVLRTSARKLEEIKMYPK
jgi:hypothetical protein